MALVTGASSGIGAATARSLARQGAGVALVARRTDRLEELASGIRDLGRACLPLTADLRDAAQARLKAVLQTSQQALPHLLRAAGDGPRGVADLVTLSSVAGRVARPRNSVYSATKHAVGAFSEALRQEMTGRAVRVGLIEPGMTIGFMVTQPAHAAVNEILVRPTAREH